MLPLLLLWRSHYSCTTCCPAARVSLHQPFWCLYEHMLSGCLCWWAWCGWSHALCQLFPGLVPRAGGTSAFSPACGARGWRGGCSRSPARRSHGDNRCAAELWVTLTGVKGRGSRCSCLSPEQGRTANQIGLGEQRALPVLKHRCAWSKA